MIIIKLCRGLTASFIGVSFGFILGNHLDFSCGTIVFIAMICSLIVCIAFAENNY